MTNPLTREAEIRTPLQVIQAEYKRSLGKSDSFPRPSEIIAALEVAGYKIIALTAAAQAGKPGYFVNPGWEAPATPGRADDKWRASLEEAREYVRNLWRNKALREREHYALIAILNDVERLASSPPPPAPTSEIERGMRQTYDVTGDVWFKFAADHIATLTKELAEAQEEIERLKDELFNAQTPLP